MPHDEPFGSHACEEAHYALFARIRCNPRSDYCCPYPRRFTKQARFTRRADGDQGFGADLLHIASMYRTAWSSATPLWLDHILGPNEAIEGRIVYKAKLKACFLEGQATGMGMLGDPGRVVVTDRRSQGRYQHQ